jgi:hypothetical protein
MKRRFNICSFKDNKTPEDGSTRAETYIKLHPVGVCK